MYKIKNLLFGYDYIQWRNSADSGIARVISLPDGRICYWRYKGLNILDEIKTPYEVFWLTCSPDKYGFTCYDKSKP